MKKHFLKKHEENWLRIPYEENADPCIITISDSTGKKETIQMKVSKTRVDYWMAYPLKDFFGDDIQAEGPASRWINAIELSDFRQLISISSNSFSSDFQCSRSLLTSLIAV